MDDAVRKDHRPRSRKRFLLTTIASITLLVLFASSSMTLASPAIGVTRTELARGTLDAFRVRTGPRSPVDMKVESKAPVDIVVRGHDYQPHSSTGWHTHPGPVLITVTEGTVTFYEYDDPTCTPTVVSAGQSYVDTGQGHIGRNERGVPARDVTVIFAPVGGVFRSELDAPGPHCDF